MEKSGLILKVITAVKEVNKRDNWKRNFAHCFSFRSEIGVIYRKEFCGLFKAICIESRSDV